MTPDPTQPGCRNCPPGYDCETGNYSYDDFEEIRDEQKARLATCRYPECECDRDYPCVPERPESLTRWLTWLNIADCPCPYGWQSLGTLYRVSMGKGWVRLSADPACKHHGESR